MIRTIIFVLGFFLLATPVFAVSVTISNTPSSINDEPFNLDVSVSGAQAGTNYLRANLFSSGTTKYFGYTYNGTDFVNSSDYSQYFPVTIDSSGSWTGSIQAKLDPDSSYFTGSGTYNLKVRRYTQFGSSYTWSNEVTLVVNIPTPSPTPSPSPSATPTPSPSPSPSATISSANNSSGTKVKTTSSLSKNSSSLPNDPTPSQTPQIKTNTIPSNSIAKVDYHVASVAGAAASGSTNPSSEIKSQKQTNIPLITGVILIIIGAGSLSYVYLRHKFGKRNQGFSS